jgi:hypothetical protein
MFCSVPNRRQSPHDVFGSRGSAPLADDWPDTPERYLPHAIHISRAFDGFAPHTELTV